MKLFLKINRFFPVISCGNGNFKFLIKVPSLVSGVDAGVILFLEECQVQLDVFRNVFHCNMKLFSQEQWIFCRNEMWKW